MRCEYQINDDGEIVLSWISHQQIYDYKFHSSYPDYVRLSECFSQPIRSRQCEGDEFYLCPIVNLKVNLLTLNYKIGCRKIHPPQKRGNYAKYRYIVLHSVANITTVSYY